MERLELPREGQEFSYTYRGQTQFGKVRSSRYDANGEVVVEVEWRDGEYGTFWNSSFLGRNLNRDESLTVLGTENA